MEPAAGHFDHLQQLMQADDEFTKQEQQQQNDLAIQSAVSLVPAVQGGVVEYMVNGTKFVVDSKFVLTKCMGFGAYGIVCAAVDTVTSENVAIKRIGKAFQQLKDTKRTLREIKLMRHFQHENIISIKDILKPPSKALFEDVYIVTELMDSDLHQIISSDQELSDEHCKYFIYQILCGLKAIHSANVLHRDLKPSNVLVNGDCQIKICDFGLARDEEQQSQFMTEYVATRWYRAPEVILSWKLYSRSIDVWGVGCIFAELLGRKPIFTGKDYIHQITRIIEIIGSPTEDDLSNIGSEQARFYVRSLGVFPSVPFQKLYPKANPLGLDLLSKMLTFDPNKRITVEEALAHPYLAKFHDPNEEPVAKSIFNFDFENWDLIKDMVKDLIWNEMLQFHPEAAIEEEKREKLNEMQT